MTEPIATDQVFISKLTDIVLVNLHNEHFGVNDLAREAGVSRFIILRKLRKTNNQSVSQFIREVRLKRAMELLQQHAATASEIAYSVGFGSPAYFTKCFHDHYGYPPGDVLKMPPSTRTETEAGDEQDVVTPGVSAAVNEKAERLTSWPLPPKAVMTGVAILAVIVATWFLLDLIANGHYSFKDFFRKPKDRSIMVLPFKNLSQDPEYQYFADGLMEDVLNNLFMVNDLRVISRTTSECFRDSRLTASEIGKKINVRHLLEGSIRIEDDNVRVTVQLIDTRRDAHLWSFNYDHTLSDVIGIQGDIAMQVAEKLQVLLSSAELLNIESAMTHHAEAYDFYLRGMHFLNQSYREPAFSLAHQMFDKAIDLDTGFALAYAGLAQAYRSMHWFYADRNEVNLMLARKNLEKALSLLPKSKVVLQEEALYHYQCRRDYPESLRLLNQLRKKYPRDDELPFYMAMVYKRMGEFNKSIDYCREAILVNPFFWKYWFEMANVESFIEEYSVAEKNYLKAIELNPSEENLYAILFRFYLLSGQTGKASVFLERNKKYFDPGELKFFKAWLAYIDRDYENAIQILQTLSDDQMIYSRQSRAYSKHLQLGLIYHAARDDSMAAIHFNAEHRLMQEMISESGNDDRYYRTLGIAAAGLGRKEEALEALARAKEIRSPSNDRIQGYLPEADLVTIFVLLGEYEEALTRIEKLIGKCDNLTVAMLQYDPLWDPLRGKERFKAILANG